MANQEQLAILMQGVKVWNKWLMENPDTEIDLIKADLSGANLRESYLSGANLSEANLTGANLTGATLKGAKLGGAKLTGATLWEANLSGADLGGVDLSGADLSGADLIGANLTGANLTAKLTGATLWEANLSGADLVGVDLIGADLREANLSGAIAAETIFGNTDLSETIGLEQVIHYSSSTIGTDTLQLFKGKIPIEFLRGCGLSDFEIETAKLYNPDLTNQEINDILYKIYALRAGQAIQVSPLFISYSHDDAAFVDRLEGVLNEKGIRFWRDIHDAVAGRLETQIERAIRLNPTVLLVLSAHAAHSDWVEHEVRQARGLEKELKRDVLCPVALDGSWKDSPWPQRVMEQVLEYNILDFSMWQDEQVFGQMFVKLLDGLQLFYKNSQT